MILYETPILQCPNKRGQMQFWQGIGCKEDGKCYYYTLTWHSLANGSMSARTNSVPSKVTGKNLGRSNETTDEEQLAFEVSVLERKKREEGYYAEGEEPPVLLPLPMLAHTYFDTIGEDGKVKKGHKPKIIFPCYCQPKYDGFRAPSDGVQSWSRKGKLWPQECVKHVLCEEWGLWPDGEVMLPLDMDFELLKTAMSKFVPGLTDKIGYHVYDLMPDGTTITADMPFEVRDRIRMEKFELATKKGWLPENTYAVKSVLVPDAYTLEEVMLSKALKFGYEGIMARNAKGLYVFKHRSYDLQKVKLFQEDEFEIVGVKDGKGSDEAALMYTCVTKEGKEFDVRPKGNIFKRKQLWQQWLDGTYDPIGKMLTVEFFEYSKYGVPRFNKGKGIRDYE
jgi:DNA ligase-1